MTDVIDEALRGVCKAYLIVHPERCPDAIPAFGLSDDDDQVISTIREYLEVCRTCLDVCGAPTEVAPDVAFAAGFFGCQIFFLEHAMRDENLGRANGGDKAAGKGKGK